MWATWWRSNITSNRPQCHTGQHGTSGMPRTRNLNNVFLNNPTVVQNQTLMFDNNNNSYSWTCYLQQWSIQLLDTRYIIALCQLPRVCVPACVHACVRAWPAILFKVTYLALLSKRLPTPDLSIRDSPTITGVRFYKLDIASIKNINVSLKWN